jgi:hypothetical protein
LPDGVRDLLDGDAGAEAAVRGVFVGWTLHGEGGCCGVGSDDGGNERLRVGVDEEGGDGCVLRVGEGY